MADQPALTWPSVLNHLLKGADLTSEQASWAMGQILSGDATPAQVAGFMIALRMKGETVQEVEGFVEAMYAHATTIDVPGRSVDIVGTGGDGAHTVNISTMAALVAAGAGAQVVKHGNRAASSRCGAADLIEALGVPLDLEPSRVAEIASETGITFCFAPRFHPAMRHAAQPRRELGVPTTFNVLGPMCNPARPQAQAVGVADRKLAALVAGVFAARGVDALVFRGDDGLDELTTTTTSSIWVVRDGTITEERFDPADLGIPRATPEELRGGDVSHNVEVCRRLLAGESGPVRDAVLLNAAAALAVFEPSDASLSERLAAAYERARQSLDEGQAAAVLERWLAAATR
ncbi:anthranilate phosphoribosyltransferase [Thermasporomyces composti]|jgi:anthranilate phosphoribosyltransferase|uniref:Anthranilate phosphoribosyltransferase n=1 Tax=Thermasporomyces composti TaxID=696763 RepID=A0A3D9V780_THECX|nr:anthranilate phosphoribosyltransferase [Thermasporomyces composti]REF34895.1 anthranilate phosphoribosyltransferase [Thermasporomyces composti]